MAIGYVKELDEPISLLDKIRYHFFNEIEVEKFEDNYIFRIPICEKNIAKKFHVIMEKLFSQMQKHKISTVIFSDKLSSESDTGIVFRDEFYREKLGQVDQKKKLMEYMPFQILEYILKIQQRDIRQEDVYFLIKKDNRKDFSFLDDFIQSCKTVNIITNDISRFQKIQQDLYEQEDILIGVSNNRSKSLRKARYVFNVNMDNKDLEKLRIHRDAIIIHMQKDGKYEENCFQGINVNQLLLTLPDEYVEKMDRINALDVDKFNLEKFYEAMLLEKLEKEKNKSLVQAESYIKKDYFYLASEIIEKDEIEIRSLVGSNGIISKDEIIDVGKRLYENDKKLYEKAKCLN